MATLLETDRRQRAIADTLTKIGDHPDRLGEQFERVYADADGRIDQIPWEDGRANPALVNWLNAIAPSLIRCGSRVAVVGCGLGDDARELIRRGYDVTAFDCSPTAVDWARRLDPDNAYCYVCGDLFQPDPHWRHRFDLVVEVHTLQSLPPKVQKTALHSISELLAPHGHLLLISHASDAPPALEDGPPWPLTEQVIRSAVGESNLKIEGGIACFIDDEVDPPVRRMRALLRRGS